MKLRQIPGWIVVLAAMPVVFAVSCAVTFVVCSSCERQQRRAVQA